MSSNEWRLGRNGPVAKGGMEISVTDSGAVNLDNTLARSQILGLFHSDCLELGFAACLLDDGSFLFLRDIVVWCHSVI